MTWLINLVNALFKKTPTVAAPEPVAAPAPAPVAPPADPVAELIAEAKKWIGTRESGGDNHGPEVEEFQKAVDGKARGEAWCMAFAQFCVLRVAARLSVPEYLFKSESCLEVWNKTDPSRRLHEPEPGCLMIWQHGTSAQGHTGIVVRVDGQDIHTIEGNTGDGQGVVRDGDGVYERTRHKAGSAAMVVKGWVRPF